MNQNGRVATMNPYNPKAICPKCGSKDIGTWYAKTGDSCYVRGYHSHTQVESEHLDRTCRNCGYVWAEMCLDVSAVASTITEEELARFVKRCTVVPESEKPIRIPLSPDAPGVFLTNVPRPLTETELALAADWGQPSY